jgi:hypothetical protein
MTKKTRMYVRGPHNRTKYIKYKIKSFLTVALLMTVSYLVGLYQGCEIV